MRRSGKPRLVPIQLIEPLTVILRGDLLKRLNEYREAAFRLSDEGWPEDAKADNGPDRNPAKYRPQHKRARHESLDFLCEQADAHQRGRTAD